MKKLLPLFLVPWVAFGQPNPSSGPFPVPPFTYTSNETHTLTYVTTNTIWVSGAGDAAVNSSTGGPYILKTPVGAFSIYTNTLGTEGLNYDPGAFNLPTEGQITNSAGNLR